MGRGPGRGACLKNWDHTINVGIISYASAKDIRVLGGRGGGVQKCIEIVHPTITTLILLIGVDLLLECSYSFLESSLQADMLDGHQRTVTMC